MNVTSQPKRCPKCGTAIPSEAPQGLCPKCLLAQASIPTDTGKGTPSVPPTQQELAAAFPQLEILELIGQGGMGFVFKARQPKLERLVALKILPESFASNPAFADRFTREGRVLARLNHPNIVTIHDLGQANGFFYLLMEFVDGVNLRQAMRTGRFTPEQALAVVPRICDALQFAHSEGILHRDIKPENILLDPKGRIKIADFGIAKLLSQAPSDAHLTESGGTLGTPHYMAPEQIEKPATVDHRADIYSLGVVFYEMLTGELPLGKFQPPSQKVEVDVRLDEVVLHALEKEPARRYQQVSEVKTAVETISSSDSPSVQANRPLAVAPAVLNQKPDRFWRGWAIGSASLLALILISAAFVSVRARRAQAQALRAEAAARHMQATLRNAQLKERSDVHESAAAQMVIEPEKFDAHNPEQSQWNWAFKLFVPPDHLASLLFVLWTNGVPTVDVDFSAYFKVGKEGGIDVPFCSLSCQRVVESERFSRLTAEQQEQSLAGWRYPKSAGLTNAVWWNVNLGAGSTLSRWVAMPPYQRVETALPQSVESSHQLSFHLVEFSRTPEPSNGWSGVELRFLLEPLRLAPVRMLPTEKDMTNYVAGHGLAWTMDEALKRLTNQPRAP